jgi:hypothetical protein
MLTTLFQDSTHIETWIERLQLTASSCSRSLPRLCSDREVTIAVDSTYEIEESSRLSNENIFGELKNDLEG